jgi:hypothetical protein
MPRRKRRVMVSIRLVVVEAEVVAGAHQALDDEVGGELEVEEGEGDARVDPVGQQRAIVERGGERGPEARGQLLVVGADVAAGELGDVDVDEGEVLAVALDHRLDGAAESGRVLGKRAVRTKRASGSVSARKAW